MNLNTTTESLAQLLDRLGPPTIDVSRTWCQQLAKLPADQDLFQWDPSSTEVWAKLTIGMDGLLNQETWLQDAHPSHAAFDGTQADWIRQFHEAMTNVGSIEAGSANATALEAIPIEVKKDSDSSEPQLIDREGLETVTTARGIEMTNRSRWPYWSVAAVASCVAAGVFFWPSDSPVPDSLRSGSPLGESRDVDSAINIAAERNPSVSLVPKSDESISAAAPATLLGDRLDDGEWMPEPLEEVMPPPNRLFPAMTAEASQHVSVAVHADLNASLGLPASMSMDEPADQDWDTDEKADSVPIPSAGQDDAAVVPDDQNIAVQLSSTDVFVEHHAKADQFPAGMTVTAFFETADEFSTVWIDDIAHEKAKRARGLLVVHESGEDPTGMSTPVIAIAVDVRAGRGIKTRLRTAVRTGAGVAWQNIDPATLQTYAQSIANRSVQMDQAIARLSAFNGNAHSRQKALARMRLDQIKTAAKQLAETSQRVADLIALTEKFATENNLRLSFAASE